MTELRVGQIDQRVVVLDIEMMMRIHVGVEVGLRAGDADLTQQAELR